MADFLRKRIETVLVVFSPSLSVSSLVYRIEEEGSKRKKGNFSSLPAFRFAPPKPSENSQELFLVIKWLTRDSGGNFFYSFGICRCQSNKELRFFGDSKNSNTHSKTSSRRRQEVGGGPLCKRLSLSAFREIGLDRHTTNGKGKQRWRRSPEWARDLPKLESTREKLPDRKSWAVTTRCTLANSGKLFLNVRRFSVASDRR